MPQRPAVRSRHHSWTPAGSQPYGRAITPWSGFPQTTPHSSQFPPSRTAAVPRGGARARAGAHRRAGGARRRAPVRPLGAPGPKTGTGPKAGTGPKGGTGQRARPVPQHRCAHAEPRSPAARRGRGLVGAPRCAHAGPRAVPGAPAGHALSRDAHGLAVLRTCGLADSRTGNARPHRKGPTAPAVAAGLCGFRSFGGRSGRGRGGAVAPKRPVWGVLPRAPGVGQTLPSAARSAMSVRWWAPSRVMRARAV